MNRQDAKTAKKERKNMKRRVTNQVRVIEEILRRWDPIGVHPGEIAPADEYDSYAPHIVALVNQRCSVKDLARHLESVRTQTIGVGRDYAKDRKIALELIGALLGLRTVLGASE